MTDVVSLLGLPQPSASRSSYYVRCPCCDGEHNRHLNINLKKEVFRCAKCGVSGGIFDLYALFTGTDRDRVWRELTEQLRLNERPPLPEQRGYQRPGRRRRSPPYLLRAPLHAGAGECSPG